MQLNRNSLTSRIFYVSLKSRFPWNMQRTQDAVLLRYFQKIDDEQSGENIEFVILNVVVTCKIDR